MKVVKIMKFTKTAKFTVFCKTNDKIQEIYSKGCKEGPSKVTKIAKIMIFSKTATPTLTKIMKITNFMKFLKTGNSIIICQLIDGTSKIIKGLEESLKQHLPKLGIHHKNNPL